MRLRNDDDGAFGRDVQIANREQFIVIGMATNHAHDMGRIRDQAFVFAMKAMHRFSVILIDGVVVVSFEWGVYR